MWLTVREPDRAARRVEVGLGAFSVGRSADCDLVLVDPKASRRHAVIEGRADGSFTLRDLASANGTRVDGQKIAAMIDGSGLSPEAASSVAFRIMKAAATGTKLLTTRLTKF